MTRLARSDERNESNSAMMAGIVSASERIAPVHGLHPSERSRDLTICGCSPGSATKALLDGQQRIAAHIHGPLFGKVEIDDRNLFLVDVLPDIHLRPVGERKDANAFAGMDARVVEVPQLGALVLRVPLPGAVAEGVDALLGAGLLFIAPRAAEGRVEVVVAQRIEQRLRLQQSAAALGVQRDGIRARGDGRLIAPDQQLRAHRARHLIAEGEHLGEFEAGVHVQQGKRNRRGIEGLLRQPQHDGGILADGVEHDRPLKLRGHFAQDVNALRFQQAQMAQAPRSGCARWQRCDR